jgi:hypothetical protein
MAAFGPVKAPKNVGSTSVKIRFPSIGSMVSRNAHRFAIRRFLFWPSLHAPRARAWRLLPTSSPSSRPTRRSGDIIRTASQLPEDAKDSKTASTTTSRSLSCGGPRASAPHSLVAFTVTLYCNPFDFCMGLHGSIQRCRQEEEPISLSNLSP